jgi:peptidoglycan/LPS O-acetylase OafA/YrhL
VRGPGQPGQPRSPRRERSGALDGLRGLAALAVLGFHVWLYRVNGLPGPRRTLSAKIFFELNLGLICFFVLSGYLLYRPFARAALARARVDLGRYCLRRAARIMPAYYACLAGSLLLYWAVGADSLVPPAGQVALFGVFAQSYSMHTLTAINAVSWTLCVEVAFYLLLPLIGLLALRLGPRRMAGQAALLVGLVLVTLGWNALVHFRHWDPVASKSLVAYAGDFAVGMLAALWLEWRRGTDGIDPVAADGPVAREARAATLGRAATAGVALAGIVLVVATGYWHERWGSRTAAHGILTDLPAAVGFSLLVAALAAGRGPLLRWFSARPLLAAGAISYGIYLWHIPVILALRQLDLLPAALLPRFAAVFVPTVLLASISWTCLERPLIRRAAAARPSLRPARMRRAVGVSTDG